MMFLSCSYYGHDDVVVFTLPRHNGDMGYARLLDTNLQKHDGESNYLTGSVYTVTAKSLVLFRMI
jgi:hypothetical protein